MAKPKTVFFCRECGCESGKWLGQCPACKAWDSLVEAPKETAGNRQGGVRGLRPAKPVTLKEVSLEAEERISTQMTELNRVLGGGIVVGSLVLVGGDPGIGKSTLLLQMCRLVSGQGTSVLYVSGEESLRQIRMRAVRIGEFSDHLKLMAETQIPVITETVLQMKPAVVIIDSIQTMVNPELDSAPGSVGQVREITSTLLRLAKEQEISVFIIGHVTKEGQVAGPRMLEQMVDTVLYFVGETSSSYRVLRAVKNRFGSTNEIGVFEMQSTGLREVENPSEHMLMGMPEGEPGSVVTVTLEGTRPILVEVQALICRTSFNLPRRTAVGTDYNRLNLLMAVMERRLGAQLSGCDAYINVAGGMRVTEPALDLGMVLAIFSGYRNQALPSRSVAFGEVGLTGEIRSVTQARLRVREAAKLGYQTCILPQADLDAARSELPEGLTYIGVRNLTELKKLFS